MTRGVFRALRVLQLAPAIAAVLACGCDGPEAFHKTSDSGIVTTGTGGRGFGSGGSTFGSGGSTFGSGGSTFNTGGSTFNTGGSTFNTGGSTFGTGGAATGGRGTGGAGTGGMATGGMASGGSSTGGRGTGGTGTGGRGTGGAGTGGMGMGGAGTAGTGAGGRGTGGAGVGGAGTGTGPCMGLCSNPILITTVAYNSGDLGTGATCHETLANIQGGNCSNFMNPRTFTVNGTAVILTGNWPSVPAKRNGGYCFQASAGDQRYASFVTF